MQFFVAVLQYRLAGRGAAASAMNLAFNVFASFLGLLIAAPLVGPILDRRDDGVALIRRAATAQAVGFNQGRTRVIQRRFNVSVPRAPVL